MNPQSRKRMLGITLGLILFLIIGIFLPLRALSQQGTTVEAETPAADAALPTSATAQARTESIHLMRLSSYSGSGAEIPAYDPETNRLFVVTGEPEMEILDISDPLSPALSSPTATRPWPWPWPTATSKPTASSTSTT